MLLLECSVLELWEEHFCSAPIAHFDRRWWIQVTAKAESTSVIRDACGDNPNSLRRHVPYDGATDCVQLPLVSRTLSSPPRRFEVTLTERGPGRCADPWLFQRWKFGWPQIFTGLSLLALAFSPPSPAQSSIANHNSIEFVEVSPPFPAIPFPTKLRARVIEDSAGFLWMSDGMRLFRFDGTQYRQFTSGNRNALFPNSWVVWDIAGGRHSTLCATAPTNHILLYDIVRNSRQVISIKQAGPGGDRRISCSMEDRSGRFWIGTEEGEVFRIQLPDTDAGIVYGGSVPNKAANSIRAIAEDSLGNIWIGGHRGLLYIPANSAQSGRPPSEAATFLGLPCETVAGLASGKDGRLWVSMADGSFGWISAGNGSVHTIASMPLLSGRVEWTMFGEDRNGDLWVGTPDDGLFHWKCDSNNWDKHFVRGTGKHDRVVDQIDFMFLDRSGMLWVKTSDRGLLRYLPPRRAFRSYPSGDGRGLTMHGRDVHACTVDRFGTLWAGSFAGGLEYLTRGAPRFARFLHSPTDTKSLSQNSVINIRELRNGELWVGTVTGGINIFDRRTNTFAHLTHVPENPASLGSDNIKTIYEDSRGFVWIGHAIGLDRFDPASRTFSPVIRWPAWTLNLIGSVAWLCEDGSSHLWAGTYGHGLYRLNPNTGDTVGFRHNPADPRSLASDYVSSVFVDSEDRLWVGTSVGLSSFDPVSGEFRNLTLPVLRRTRSLVPEAASSSGDIEIRGILEDSSGHLWLSLADGGVGKYSIKKNEFTRYGKSDGVVVTEGRRGAFFMLPDGTIYCGGTGGVTVFHPSKLRVVELQPHVALIDFRVVGEPRSTPRRGAEIHSFPYWQNTFTFGFTMLDFRAPDENQYQYMLQGADRDWITADREPTVTYANLSPGHYRFVVRGRNANAVPSANEDSLELVVEVPYWQSWWFRFFTVGIVAGTFLFVYGRKVSRLRKERRTQQEFSRRQIEFQEAERKRLAAELHDGVGQDLLVVSNELQQFLKECETFPDNVGRAAAVVQESIRTVREISSNLHPHHLERLGLRAAIEAMVDTIRHSSGLTVDLDCDDVDRTLPKETRIHVYRIIQEALSNAVRHARATKITVQLRNTTETVRAIVSDNGRGMVEDLREAPAPPEGQRRHGFGLSSMNERARIIHGTLHITPTSGSGTTVTLMVPIL